MYKKILAPLDGSELSECTLEHLKAVATGCQVPEVVLLRVVEPLPQVYDDGGLSPEWHKEAQKKAGEFATDYLAKVAASLKKEGIAAETASVSGRAADAILNYAKEHQVDLVVMSTHGRSGVSRWVLGSVADRVVRHSPVPVLTVPPAGCRID
jgi:nucleotide-binding universal stress UspA family protein